MKIRAVVHLVNGSAVAGASEETTLEELEQAKKIMADNFGDLETLNVEGENGSWAVFPMSSVLYVEYEVTEL